MAEAASLIEWLQNASPWELLGYAAVAILGARRAIDGVEQVAKALERIGRAPEQVRAWLERRAERIVSAEREREALQHLVANSERLIAQLEKNGGKSFRDEVFARFDEIEAAGAARFDRLEVTLNEHLAEQPPIMAEFRDVQSRLSRLERASMA